MFLCCGDNQLFETFNDRRDAGFQALELADVRAGSLARSVIRV
jgi:hypothetical protein